VYTQKEGSGASETHCARLGDCSGEKLRIVLDPQGVYGEDFPRETFHVLKGKEMKAYGDAAQSNEVAGVGEAG
jgi:hypothetical protein